MQLKQMEITEKEIGNSRFYIKPFPAFVAANISGDLVSVLTPMLGALSAIMGKDDITDEEGLPIIGQALSGLNGESLEKMIRKLLIDNKNISVEAEITEGKTKPLTMDIANEIFCGEVQDMYLLCWEVIKLNFGGFFRKLGVQFGNLSTDMQGTPTSQNGAN